MHWGKDTSGVLAIFARFLVAQRISLETKPPAVASYPYNLYVLSGGLVVNGAQGTLAPIGQAAYRFPQRM